MNLSIVFLALSIQRYYIGTPTTEPVISTVGAHARMTIMIAHIRHIIIIECPPEIVYNALTTKEGIQGWWTVDTVIESKVGSTAEFIFGDKYHNKMKITDLQPAKRVAWYCIQGDPEWIGTDFTFDLVDKAGHTILRFGQNNWRELTDFYAYCNFQWGQYMISLKNYCEAGTGKPFRPQVIEKE